MKSSGAVGFINAPKVDPVGVSAGAVREAAQSACQVFEHLQFRFPLRKYQNEILDLVNQKVASGEREIHVVAPPGAGKTIIGLQMVLNFKRPSLILTPNTTIQAQWSEKLSLFMPSQPSGLDPRKIIGTHEERPLKPITVLTYQVLSTPGREQEYLTQLAQREWVDELRANRALSIGEAELRILEIMQNNPRAHQQEMSRHMSRIRRKLTDVLKLEEVLHRNALDLLQTLRRQEVGLVIFDECHHLTDYWAAIMAHLLGMLDEPIVVALTGTPPEGKTSTQENRYASLVGNIDYQVPTPALVREGGLAPFQDLVFITQPTAKEFAFLEDQHQDFHALVQELTGESAGGSKFSTVLASDKSYHVVDQNGKLSPILTWVLQRAIAASDGDGWCDFADRRSGLSVAMLRCLWQYRLPVPAGSLNSKDQRISCQEVCQPLNLDDWMLLLEDFASHKLKLSDSADSHALFERIKRAARKLGFGITERGLRRQASPVDRVLAFSKSKASAAAEILAIEYASLKDKLRAIVVTDFERMSYTGLQSVRGVLNEDSGGATGVLRCLLGNPISSYIHPCLVTGSLLLIDRRIKEPFKAAAEQFLEREGISLSLSITDAEDESFSQISALGSEWESKLYVRLATELFEQGISKCLIGTRGLFGEGWDSQELNTLIDLTTTTAPVSVKQLRGRSIRIQSKRREETEDTGPKVANNWDIVCVAPSLEKGLNDYGRFVRKHESFFGLADDGQIERGVGHVHPDLSELTGAEVFSSHKRFNQEMSLKARARSKVFDLWKVGSAYANSMVVCLEIQGVSAPYLPPPFLKYDLTYSEHSRQLRGCLRGIWFDFLFVGAAISFVSYLLLPAEISPVCLIFPALGCFLAYKKYCRLQDKFIADMSAEQDQKRNLFCIARAALSALKRTSSIKGRVTADDIVISERSNGCFRIFLEGVDYPQSKLFVETVQDALRPIRDQDYLLGRCNYVIEEADDNGSKENQDGRVAKRKFFAKYLSGRLTPSLSAYHPVPRIFAKSEKGRQAFTEAWNKYVSPAEILMAADNPKIVNKYFGKGPTLAKRILWE